MHIEDIQALRCFLLNYYYKKSGSTDYAEKATRLRILSLYGILI